MIRDRACISRPTFHGMAVGMEIWLLVLRILLAALLYTFLAAIFWILWRDIQGTTADTGSARLERSPAAQLIVLDAPDGQPPPGVSFPLEVVTSIGRAPTNTLPLPDVYASAHHALVTWREGQWWVEDQDSRNGTWLNDVRISSPTVLSAGDVIGVGRTKLKLEFGGAAHIQREENGEAVLYQPVGETIESRGLRRFQTETG